MKFLIKYQNSQYAFSMLLLVLSFAAFLAYYLTTPKFSQTKVDDFSVALEVSSNTSGYNPMVNTPSGFELEVEDFNEGGQNVGYFDKSNGNSGDYYRDGDVDTKALGNGNFAIISLDKGEWLKYDINLTAGDTYEVSLRYAALQYNPIPAVQLKVNGSNPVNVPSNGYTGGYNNFVISESVDIDLPAGPSTLEVFVSERWMHLDKLIFMGEGRGVTEASSSSQVSTSSSASSSSQTSTNTATSATSSSVSTATISSSRGTFTTASNSTSSIQPSSSTTSAPVTSTSSSLHTFQVPSSSTSSTVSATFSTTSAITSNSSATNNTSSTESGNSCLGDYNQSGNVDLDDFVVFAENYNKSPISCSLDLTGNDCYLNLSDLAVFVSGYRQPGYCS